MPELKVLNQKITYIKIDDEDYISITDMLKSKDGDFFVSDWLRNRNTIEFLGIWEEIHSPNFNYGEFAIIKSQAGLNSYKISVKEWTEKANAIEIISKAGRYGGTYAHKDIAFEFGMWIRPKFKLLLIKEFERLKAEEQKQIGWNAKRELSKINYRIHTDAIKNNLVPKELTKSQINFVYAEEADVLNMALFGITAKEWRTNIAIEILYNQRFQNQIMRHIYQPVKFAHKTGTLDYLSHDVGVMNINGRLFYIGISVFNSKFKDGNKKLIGNIGKIIYDALVSI